MNNDNPLLAASNAVAPGGTTINGASESKPSVTSLFRAAQGENPAVTNKVYRESHEASKPTCTVKLITNSRIYGTRGSGGSRLAKSAIRLAIDTGVKSPSTFESSTLRCEHRVKPFTIPGDTPADAAVELLNTFEMKFGGKATTEFVKNMSAYKQSKTMELQKLGITTQTDGKPLFKDEATQAAYFKDMEAKSFSYYEVYLSVKPKGGRATRSKSFRAMSVEELRKLFPNYKFEI